MDRSPAAKGRVRDTSRDSRAAVGRPHQTNPRARTSFQVELFRPGVPKEGQRVLIAVAPTRRVAGTPRPQSEVAEHPHVPAAPRAQALRPSKRPLKLTAPY